MFVSTGLFLARLVGKPFIGQKAARLVGVAALVLAAVAAFLIWLAVHDSNVIDAHDSEREAKINAGVIVADRTATAAQDERDEVFANSQILIDTGISNAVAAAPVETRKPVGPASQSYFDTLRREQQAKKGNK
jgi:hypothetical protein